MKITEAEEVVRQRLGTEYGVAKLSRYWLIWKRVPGGSYTDQQTGSLVQSTSLDKAIREVE